MAGSHRFMRRVPAFLLLLSLAASLSLSSYGQRRHGGSSPLDTVGKNPSQEKGWEILETFRSMGWSGGYRWRVQLKLMPYRKSSRYLNGLIMGDRQNESPVTRIDLVERPVDVDAEGTVQGAQTLRMLFQSGKGAYAMRKRSWEEGPPEVVDSAQALETIAGSDFTLFDLMAPYIYWPRFRYEGRTTFLGSPTHLFWMYPPEEDAFLSESIGGVRLYISDQFNALMRTEVFDAQERKLKTISIGGFRKVDGQFIFKEMDVKNEATKNKTRLKIVDAQMGLRLPKSLFEPQSLMSDLQSVSGEIELPATFENVQ